MRYRPIILTALLSSQLISVAYANQQPLLNFIKPNPQLMVTNHGVSVADKKENNQQKEKFRRITFNPIDTPTITFTPAKDKTGTWDLSNTPNLHLRLQNAMDWDLTLYVDIKDTSGKTVLRSTVALPAGPAQTLLIPLKATNGRAWGMRIGLSKPWKNNGTLYLFPTDITGSVDHSKITSISLSIDKPAAAQSILLDDITTSSQDAERFAYTGIVDTYGQNTHTNYPEKIANDQQLREAAQAEQQQLNVWQNSAIVQDTFGGVGDKPLFKATGFFRTEKKGEQWYLVTPKGYPFVSLGVNSVIPDNSQTYVEGRTFMFDQLPKKGSPLAAFYGYANTSSGNAAQGGRGVDKGLWYDFYQANLYRESPKYTQEHWRELTAQRLKAWNFNTLGNWSDPQLIKKSHLAYTLPLLIQGSFASVPSGADWWGQMPDPFDPRFDQAVEKAVIAGTKGHQQDPWLIGYFADNELSWGGMGQDDSSHYALALNALKLPLYKSPAKRAFIEQLKTTYKTADNLAKAWGIKLANWQTIEQPNFNAPLPSSDYPNRLKDYSQFLTHYADTYFGKVKASLTKHDPNHLLLGGRFAAKVPEAIASCAKYCDVISFNVYTPEPQQGYDAALIAKLDKPILISEFSFGSKATGSLWAGPVEVADEQARNKAYQTFVSKAFEDPRMVGVHWFQYIDEPVTGRLLDGENGHLGLVTITNRPFTSFIEAVRQQNISLLKDWLNRATKAD